MSGAEIQRGRRLLQLRIGDIRLKALAKLFRADKAGADAFTVAPDQRTHPKNLAAIPGTGRFGKSNASRRSAAAAW